MRFIATALYFSSIFFFGLRGTTVPKDSWDRLWITRWFWKLFKCYNTYTHAHASRMIGTYIKYSLNTARRYIIYITGTAYYIVHAASMKSISVKLPYYYCYYTYTTIISWRLRFTFMFFFIFLTHRIKKQFKKAWYWYIILIPV